MSTESNVVNFSRIKNLTRDDALDQLERCQMAAEVTLPAANMAALLTQLIDGMDAANPQLKERLDESQRYGRQLEITIENLEAKCLKLGAENAGLKSKGREVLKEAAHVYSHFNRMVDHLDGESVDGQTLHELQLLIGSETPVTDAFLAEVRAQGAEECVRQLVISGDDDFSDAPNVCAMVAHQLRKGVQS